MPPRRLSNEKGTDGKSPSSRTKRAGKESAAQTPPKAMAVAASSSEGDTRRRKAVLTSTSKGRARSLSPVATSSTSSVKKSSKRGTTPPAAPFAGASPHGNLVRAVTAATATATRRAKINQLVRMPTTEFVSAVAAASEGGADEDMVAAAAGDMTRTLNIPFTAEESLSQEGTTTLRRTHDNRGATSDAATVRLYKVGADGARRDIDDALIQLRGPSGVRKLCELDYVWPGLTRRETIQPAFKVLREALENNDFSFEDGDSLSSGKSAMVGPTAGVKELPKNQRLSLPGSKGGPSVTMTIPEVKAAVDERTGAVKVKKRSTSNAVAATTKEYLRGCIQLIEHEHEEKQVDEDEDEGELCDEGTALRMEKLEFVNLALIELFELTLETAETLEDRLRAITTKVQTSLNRDKKLGEQFDAFVDTVDALCEKLVNFTGADGSAFPYDILDGEAVRSALEEKAPDVYKMLVTMIKQLDYRDHRNELREEEATKRMTIAAVQQMAFGGTKSQNKIKHWRLLQSLVGTQHSRRARDGEYRSKMKQESSNRTFRRFMIEHFLRCLRELLDYLKANKNLILLIYLDNLNIKNTQQEGVGGGHKSESYATMGIMYPVEQHLDLCGSGGDTIGRWVCYAPEDFANEFFGVTFVDVKPGAMAVNTMYNLELPASIVVGEEKVLLGGVKTCTCRVGVASYEFALVEAPCDMLKVLPSLVDVSPSRRCFANPTKSEEDTLEEVRKDAMLHLLTNSSLHWNPELEHLAGLRGRRLPPWVDHRHEMSRTLFPACYDEEGKPKVAGQFALPVALEDTATKRGVLRAFSMLMDYQPGPR